MKRTIGLFAITVLAVSALFASCASKGTPSEVGELLTPEQIAALPDDGSWAGRLVAVDGYPGFCKMVSMIKLDSRNKMQITSAPNCEGQTLIDANVSVRDGARTELASFGGEKSRNFVVLSKENTEPANAEYTLDDYTESDYRKFRFSGELVFENGGYFLDKVTIHAAQ